MIGEEVGLAIFIVGWWLYEIVDIIKEKLW
jgi:hypothetical protein